MRVSPSRAPSEVEGEGGATWNSKSEVMGASSTNAATKAEAKAASETTAHALLSSDFIEAPVYMAAAEALFGSGAESGLLG